MNRAQNCCTLTVIRSFQPSLSPFFFTRCPKKSEPSASEGKAFLPPSFIYGAFRAFSSLASFSPFSVFTPPPPASKKSIFANLQTRLSLSLSPFADEVKKAMNKSFQESGGTVLSTNWEDIAKKKTETKPPEGMEFKKWDQ